MNRDEVLFDGVNAVADAGGVDGFARECKAEVWRLLQERGTPEHLDSWETKGQELLLQIVHEVLTRRLDADIKRELYHAQAMAMQVASGLGAEAAKAAAAKAGDRVVKRCRKRLEIIFRKMQP